MLYKDRDDFRDVTPVEQDEGPSPLAPINYSLKYKDTMDFFRGIVRLNEYSLRSLHLTENVIRLNPSHYTVWNFRLKILLNIQFNLNDELLLLNDLLVDFLKSYQIWNHRRLLVTLLSNNNKDNCNDYDEMIGNISAFRPLSHSKPLALSELAFVNDLIDKSEDPKNYHTWVYRQWILSYFKDLFDEGDKNNELKFIDALLNDDIYNNSVWSHRYYSLFVLKFFNDDIDNEINYVLNKISIAPSNLASWNYLRGVVKLFNLGLNHSSILNFAQTLVNAKSNSSEMTIPIPALEWVADAALQIKNPVASKYFLQLVDIDPIRKSYWNYKSHLALAS